MDKRLLFRLIVALDLLEIVTNRNEQTDCIWSLVSDILEEIENSPPEVENSSPEVENNPPEVENSPPES